MADAPSYVRRLLANLRRLRTSARVTEEDLEERLILGPGWIRRFETGESLPTIDVLLAILHELGATLEDLLADLPQADAATVDRVILAEASGSDIVIHFRYADHDAQYTVPGTTLVQYEDIIKTLRDALARLSSAASNQSEAIKSDSVARCFLRAVRIWPHANPSDLWWFLVYRAYSDPYNHPARYARLDFTQSWKRTGGWALEEILVRHYGPFLKRHGINLFIADGAAKQGIVDSLDLRNRAEADKMDVVLTGDVGSGARFFGVVHVKASFAERRTDDVPLSTALVEAGYTSPLWTMDCKSGPSTRPVNRGELGDALGERSAKRKDIEDDGYFTGCFSYNARTQPSRNTLPPERRIYVCDFRDTNDQFSQFIIQRWRAFQQRA